MKIFEPYKPYGNYKAHLLKLRPKWNNPLLEDEPFKIQITEEYKPIMISAPDRGEFDMKEIPYGFQLYGYDGETTIVVLYSPGQSGRTSICVTEASVDMGMKTLSTTVNWGEESIAISDLINRLYFSVPADSED